MNLPVPHRQTTRRVAFILAIWAQDPAGKPPLWRGYIEASNGKRWYFADLDRLKRLVIEIGGWCEHNDPE